MGNPVVVLENIEKRYGFVKALKQINLTVEEGKIIGLLGHNGSGKTTMMKIIAGLKYPTTGKVQVFGMKPSAKTKKRIYFASEINIYYEWMTLAELLRFVKSFHQDLDLAKAAELLNFMNLTDTQKIGTLSRGQKARLKLVVGLARQADLMLLDEPLAGIDPPSRTKILKALVGDWRKPEQTVVITTHEVKEAEPIFDHVIFLREGQKVLEGDAETLRGERGCSMVELFEEVLE